MKTGSEIPARTSPQGQPLWRRIWKLPSTRLGWLAVGLFGAFVILMILNGAVFMYLPDHAVWRGLLISYGFTMLACGLAAGVTSLIALIRQRERSWLVWLPVLAGVFVIFLLLGELLVPH